MHNECVVHTYMEAMILELMHNTYCIAGNFRGTNFHEKLNFVNFGKKIFADGPNSRILCHVTTVVMPFSGVKASSQGYCWLRKWL